MYKLKLPGQLYGILALAALLAWPVVAQAGQTAFQTDGSGYYAVYRYAWSDPAGKAQQLAFKIPRDQVTQARRTDDGFDLSKAVRKGYEKAVEEARISNGRGAQVQVVWNGKNYGLLAAGDPVSQREARRIDRVSRREIEYNLGQYGYTLENGTQVETDYTKQARQNFMDLRPLARAIQQQTQGQSMREVMNYTLHFLQSIPYQTYDPNASANRAVFNSPLTMLSQDKGDCDEKSLAFGTLMRLLYPNLKVGLVLVPGHAFVAMQIKPEPMDMTLPINGENYVVAEAVGPAYSDVGALDNDSRQRAAISAHFQEIPSRY